MAVLPPKNKTDPRRPSLRGKVMFDVTQGTERARRWPRARGKAKTNAERERQDWFRQMQWATKYMDPRLMMDAMNAVKGTPLLPRDVLTMLLAGRMLAFNMPDGRKIFPVQAKQDVSNSLDAISQTVGYTLRRTADGWEGFPPGAGPQYELFDEITSITPRSNWDSINIPPCQQIFVSMRGINLSFNDYLIVVLSTDNGASFWTTLGDYVYLPPQGWTAQGREAWHNDNQNQNANTGVLRIDYPALAGVPKPCWNLSGAATRLFTADLSNPINALRVTTQNGSLLNSGSIQIITYGAS